MKKYIAILTVAAFAVVGHAGDTKACTDKDKAACAAKDKTACAEKDKAACPASAQASSCCPSGKLAKKDGSKKVVQSPKAAGSAGR
jgi:hypothetical protein